MLPVNACLLGLRLPEYPEMNSSWTLGGVLALRQKPAFFNSYQKESCPRLWQKRPMAPLAYACDCLWARHSPSCPTGVCSTFQSPGSISPSRLFLCRNPSAHRLPPRSYSPSFSPLLLPLSPSLCLLPFSVTSVLSVPHYSWPCPACWTDIFSLPFLSALS